MNMHIALLYRLCTIHATSSVLPDSAARHGPDVSFGFACNRLGCNQLSGLVRQVGTLLSEPCNRHPSPSQTPPYANVSIICVPVLPHRSDESRCTARVLAFNHESTHAAASKQQIPYGACAWPYPYPDRVASCFHVPFFRSATKRRKCNLIAVRPRIKRY